MIVTEQFSALDSILANGDLHSLFQPIFSLSERRILGYEALSRGPSNSALHSPINLFAVALIYGVPFLRELPIKAAEGLARVGSENKLLALGYVAGLFFALPALMMVAVK